MSDFAPTTQEEAVFQYCNYGYDKQKYTSFDDCMANEKRNATDKDGKLLPSNKTIGEVFFDDDDISTIVTNSQMPETLPNNTVHIADMGMPQNTTKEPIYYILVTAGVLIAGYFAYKKFIK